MFKFNSSRALRLSLAGAGAAVLCLVLATRVFVAFEARRAKLIKTSTEPVNGLVKVDTSFDGRVAFLGAPAAVIASIRNTSAVTETVSIVADGRSLCDVVIPPVSSKRADCVAVEGWTARADHIIEFRGASSAWTLDYLELASHHGSSTRGLYLVVLPDVADAYSRFTHAGPLTIGLVWLTIIAISFVPVRHQWSAAAVRSHRTLCGIAVLFLAAAVASPWFSPFLVTISVWSFAKVTAIFLAPQLWELGTRGWVLWRRVLNYDRRWRAVLAAAGTAAVVLLAYGLVVRATANALEGQYSGLLRVSELYFDRVPFLHDRPDVRQSVLLLPDGGYDAQFQYFAMFDPLMRRYSAEPQQYRSVADSPPYRFGRIGFPLLARVVAGNHWQNYPATMVVLVWLSVGLAAFALSLIAQRAGASPAWGLLMLAIPGFWQSVRVTLPEPVAAALLLFGFFCVLERRVVLATLLFAASLLVRETGIVLVLAIALLTQASDLTWRSRAMLVSSALPIVLWRIYVALVLWPDWGWEGLLYQPHVMTVPFAGLVGLWAELMRGQHFPEVPALARGAFWFPLLLVAVAVAALAVARESGRVVGAALLAYAVMALSFSHPTVWGHVANGQRASYEVFVVLAVATVSFHHYSSRVKGVLASCWGCAILYLLYGSHDAVSTRGALLPWG